MVLTTCATHHFRSCEDVSVRLNPYMLLVGANTRGKSTVIDAIRSFYGKDGYRGSRPIATRRI